MRFEELINEPVTEENALISIPLFDDMNSRSLKTIHQMFDRNDLPSGTVILRTDDEIASFFAIVSGKVEIRALFPGEGTERVLHELGPGRWFGEKVILEGEPSRSGITAVAVEPTTMLSLRADKFRQFVTQEAGMQAHVRGHGVCVRLSSLPFLSQIEESKLYVLAGMFIFKHVPAGVTLFYEADPADGFYIICKGSVAVSAAANTGEVKLLNTLTDGHFFGELALINNMPRTATVRTNQKSTLLFLSGANFKKFLEFAPEVKNEYFERIINSRTANHLKTIPMFDVLRTKHIGALEVYDDRRMAQLVDMFTFVRAESGQVLFREGDFGDAMYIIAQGSVRVTSSNAEGVEVEVRTMKNGEIFGQIALLQNTLRTASVTALESSVFLKLEAGKFENFLDIAPEFRDSIKNTLTDITAASLGQIPLFAAALKENKPWSKLDLLGSMFGFMRVAAGQLIFSEGDAGDTFYLISTGRVEVSSSDANGEKVVMTTLGPHAWFGEIALMSENSPRTATTEAIEDTLLLTLTKENFNRFLTVVPELREHFEVLLRQRTANTLKRVPLFSRVKENKPWSKLELLGSLFIFEQFDAGQTVFREGDPGTKFYVIHKGKVRITTASADIEETVSELGPGDYFGEIALIEDVNRNATVTAVQHLILLSLTVTSFHKFLEVAPELRPDVMNLVDDRKERLSSIRMSMSRRSQGSSSELVPHTAEAGASNSNPNPTQTATETPTNQATPSSDSPSQDTTSPLPESEPTTLTPPTPSHPTTDSTSSSSEAPSSSTPNPSSSSTNMDDIELQEVISRDGQSS